MKIVGLGGKKLTVDENPIFGGKRSCNLVLRRKTQCSEHGGEED